MSRCGNSRLKRKQKWNATVYKERNLTKEFDYITQICASNGISKSIIDTARIMYKKVSDARHSSGKNQGCAMIIRGENRVSIMAVCVSKSCETNKEPRSNEEIAEMFGLDAKKMTKGKNTLDKMRKKCMDNDLIIFDRLHVCTPEDYVRFHCKKLKVTDKDTDMAVRISTNCCKMKIATDHNAQSVAASSILAMVDYQNLDVDKRDISKLSRTSEVTITKIYGKIVPFIEALVDNDATDHIINVFKING
jgi:transcription initiation factor TFIIIB Brf1 subunit/transcription initiation factor TFIIB